jgi:hypothetical protein
MEADHPLITASETNPNEWNADLKAGRGER